MFLRPVKIFQMIFLIKLFEFRLEIAEFSLRSTEWRKITSYFLVNALSLRNTDFKGSDEFSMLQISFKIHIFSSV